VIGTRTWHSLARSPGVPATGAACAGGSISSFPCPARDKTGQKGYAPEPGVRARRAMSRRDQRLRLLIPGPSAAQTAGAVPAVSGWVPQNRHRLDADHRPCEGPPAAERGVASSFGSARPI
jgi:hypothetical protein